jgi:nucleotide-binding universal stress UspA family protein
VFVDQPSIESAVQLGERLVDGDANLGNRIGATTRRNVVVSEREPEKELVALTRREDYDLIVLRSNLRPLSGRAFFGYRVEYSLQNADCPVVVLTPT